MMVVERGLRAEEAQALLQAFFLRLREQRAAKPRWKPPVTVQTVLEALALDKKPNKNGHDGQEYDYVIEGQLEVTIEEKVMVLNPGDSIYFDSRKSHCFRSLNGEPAKFLCIII